MTSKLVSFLKESWLAQHFFTWFGFFFALSTLQPIYLVTVIVMAPLSALFWELLERYVERRLEIEPERWWDRWIVDPLTDISGSFAGWIIGSLLRAFLT